MNEIVLKLLIKLFALISLLNKDIDVEMSRFYVKSYLKKLIKNDAIAEYLQYWDVYTEDILEEVKDENDQFEYSKKQVKDICKHIIQNLHHHQRIMVLINTIQLHKQWRKTLSNAQELENLIEVIADGFKINKSEFTDLKQFIYNDFHKIELKSNLLCITEENFFPISGIKILNKQGVKFQTLVYYLQATDAFLFQFSGKEPLRYMNHHVFPDQVYVFEKGTTLCSENDLDVWLSYSDIVAQYRLVKGGVQINFQAVGVEYYYPKSVNGVHEFNFSANSGELVGIMGGSGAGKSTLINIFNGNIKIKKGKILINGYNINNRDRELRGIIGYIPQDDLLIEDLTVYQNLYYNAKLSFGQLSNSEIRNRVDRTLVEFDLWDVRTLKVGAPLKKVISGGQRKRLNISLELIRNPSVLFVDEPTSGLSSADAEKVIDLLKEETRKGSLIVVNIHQPSSKIFKQFDKLIVVDKGGFIIYIGDPVEAIGYFKKQTSQVGMHDSICKCCGIAVPDQILELVELKHVDDFGKVTDKRSVLPKEWYVRFKDQFANTLSKEAQSKELPKQEGKTPQPIKQFGIFFMRNTLSKLADRQFLIMGALVSPILALVLSFLTRYLSWGSKYVFYYNENIPAFFLMSIIIALFVGLIISAEDIFHDRKIRERERFLHLNQFSYLNSKVLFLVAFSLVQTLLFVIISTTVLEIKQFIWPFSIVFFSLSFFGNLFGLNISASFKSIVAIYIVIPLILVPQILLSGVIVKFDKLHPSITSEKVVPLIGDLMVSRWAYEALLVEQFKNNKYQKHFFELETETSRYSYLLNFLLPELTKICAELRSIEEVGYTSHNVSKIVLLNNELLKIVNTYKLESPGFINDIRTGFLSDVLLDDIEAYIDSLKKAISSTMQGVMYKKDKEYVRLEQYFGKEALQALKETHTNEKIEEFVLGKANLNKLIVSNNEIIKKYQPIYNVPDSKYGRAHFFAPVKVLGNYIIDTFWFNVLVIWLFNALLYLVLMKTILSKTILKFDDYEEE